jgi:hypothetical protein
MLRKLAELIAGDRRLIFCQHDADESCDQCVRSSPECQAIAGTPPHLMLCLNDGIEPKIQQQGALLWDDRLAQPNFAFKEDVWTSNLFWSLKERAIWKEGKVPFHVTWNMVSRLSETIDNRPNPCVAKLPACYFFILEPNHQEPSFQNPVRGRGLLINDIRTPAHDEDHVVFCNGFTGGPKAPKGNTLYVAEAAFGFLGRTQKPEALLKEGIDAAAELGRKTHFAAYTHKVG